ncbi:carbohydrate ABC transporter permease [Piscinibacter sp.]|uniref:carbohydrate ABC transporter permease n=1 Tax=Piscinibacter sp. TaxID=1903157 RepID=UPI002C428B49|nr:sugar ABC transporter permease [Albitalea sp.]HUG22675.1 sugar ABC transporter permease [Albitalea sp.]
MNAAARVSTSVTGWHGFGSTAPGMGGKEALTAWALVTPALIGFALFHAWPALRAVQISFTDWTLLREARFVGWANYAQMLQDGQFWNAMRLSACYVLLNIPLQTVLGLFLAVAMHRLTQSLFVKSVVLLPFLLSNVLVALVWLWLLDPLLGWVNHALMWMGFDRQPFFGGTGQALATVAAVNTWRHMGMVAMLFLAGLQSIPRDIIEAARLEGATEWQLFRRVTLPLLRPVMVFVLVTSVTGSFQVFDTIVVTTQGGPLDHTRVIVHYIVQNAFTFYRMGYASAMSMALCLVMVAYTVLQMRMLRASESDLG